MKNIGKLSIVHQLILIEIAIRAIFFATKKEEKEIFGALSGENLNFQLKEVTVWYVTYNLPSK